MITKMELESLKVIYSDDYNIKKQDTSSISSDVLFLIEEIEKLMEADK